MMRWALGLGFGCALSIALANPEGPQVVHGTATFTRPSANVLDVHNSHNAIINWRSFDIGAGQTTNFHQPSRASAVLNRVMSASPSQIYGKLNSNGRVFLINQHGLMIGAGAQINTAGFFGSTLNITNEDFLNGNLRFDGGGFGGISNHGYIHAGPGGNVVLIAPDIENGGVIEADDGNVILAAGESIRITSLNDAAIEFDVQAPENTIVNLGSIIANQGAARLFAGNLKHSGDINATGIVRNADGSISLVAQQDIVVEAGATLAADGDDGGRITIQSLHGTTLVAGDVSARGTAGMGGDIRILGDQVGIVDAARIDASGSAAGGQILVGGDYLGGNPDVQNARATYVGPATSLHADATEAGDGGRVIVWSDEATRSYGAISARGGPRAGDGGFIETSGGSLDLGHSVPDVSAPAGLGGEWLIDPNNIRIQATGPDANISAGPIFTTFGDGAILTTLTIDTALDGGNVTITTGTAGTNGELGNIDILDDITYNNTAANTLTFNAHNDINLLANIAANGGGPLNVIFNADSDGLNGGEIYLNGGADLAGGSFDFFSGFEATFLGGTYRNLTWTNSKAMPVTLAASNAVTFDNVVLDTDLIALDGSKISFANNLTINSTRTLTLASDGAVTALESVSTVAAVNGPGDLVLGGTAANNQVLAGANSTLTLGTGLTVSGQGSINALNASSSLVNDATIITDGFGMIIDALNWSNFNGTLIAGNDSTLTLRQAALLNDGKLQVDFGSTISTENQDLTNTGVVEGTGQIIVGPATLINDGTVGPGVGVDSPGVLNIVGNYSQTTGGILNIELDGTSPGNGPGFHDHLAISGNAALDGIMNVANVSGYAPNAFDSFQVVTFNSRTGGFANVNQPLGFDPIAVSLNSIDLFFNPGGVFFWSGGGDGVRWGDGQNWNTLTVPTNLDDVSLGAFSVTVDANSNANTLSLAAGGSLDIIGGTLTVVNGLTLAGDLSIAAGAALVVQDNAGLVHDIDVAASGRLINDGNLTNLGGSRFDGAFAQVIAGANSTFSQNADFVGPFTLANGTLQLNAGGTLANQNNSWTGGRIEGPPGPTLTLAGTPGSAKLTLSGAAPKILSGLTLDTGANELEIFGAGNLELILNAVLRNVAGGSVHHFGNGDITTDGSGQITNLGPFINFAGDTEVAVDFDNRGTGQIVNLGGILRFTGELIQSGALDVAGGIVQVADPTGGTDTGTYGVAASGALTFTTDRVLNGALDTAGLVVVDNGAALTLPPLLTFGGALELRNAATLNLGSLPATTLTMNNVLLGGVGTINGNVVNDSGVLVVGSNGAIGNLSIAGAYTQNPNAFVVVEALNNGFTTISDRLIVTGPTTLNGGTLVIGFTTTSLGLVTSNFTPFDFQGGVVGNFGSVIDAGGNILFLQRIGNQIIVLGAPPQTPEELLSALLKFIKAVRELAELIASNQAEAEAIMLALRERLEGDGSSALVCR